MRIIVILESNEAAELEHAAKNCPTFPASARRRRALAKAIAKLQSARGFGRTFEEALGRKA